MNVLRVPGRHRAAAVVAVVGLFLTSLALPGAPSQAEANHPGRPSRAAQEENDGSLKAEYDEVLGREAVLVRRVEQAQAERLRLTRELEGLQAQLESKAVELLGAQAEYDEASRLAMIYAQALKDADAKVKAAIERLRKQIVASYVHGGETAGILEAILNARNGEEAGQAMAFSHAVVGDTDRLVAELERLREERRRTDRVARTARRRAQARRDEVRAAADFITAARDQKQQLVDQVNLQVLAEASALREVQGRRALVEGRINAMTQSSDGIHMILADRQKGQPDWMPGLVEITSPMPGYHISSPFGMRHHPILNIDRLHAGGDLGAATGTPIYAAADGVVVLAEVRGGYGNATVIDHGSSLATLYGHQSQILVRAGQEVKRGDLIGLVGSTGLSTGPHLHFETRIKGMPIDPEGVVDFDAPVDYGR